MKLRLLPFACPFLLLASTGLDIPAQETPRLLVSFDGVEAFGHILHSSRLSPLENFNQAWQEPDKTLIIVFGDWQKLARLPEQALNREGLELYRKQGGNILLATDSPGDKLPFELKCNGKPVEATAKASKYQEFWDRCPLVTRWTDPLHPLRKGLLSDVATNAPSFMERTGFLLEPLAAFADGCELRNEPFPKLPKDAAYIFASPRGTPPAGRVVALAGPGVFFNGMLLQRDNANFDFGWNTVRWLSQGPNGERTKALFINDGAVVNNFALPLSGLGPIPVPPIQVINRMIRGLEEENILNRLLTENMPHKIPYLRALFILASAVLLTWGAWRIMHGGFRLDTALPALVGKWHAPPAAASVIDLRLDELRRRGNLWEPAQVLARQFFLDHAQASAPLWDDPTASRLVVDTRGGVFERMRLKRQVAQLWNLATSSPATTISPRRFDKFLSVLAEVGSAVSEGRLKVTNVDQ